MRKVRNPAHLKPLRALLEKTANFSIGGFLLGHARDPLIRLVFLFQASLPVRLRCFPAIGGT
jgi:hypothetical protein